MVWGAVEGAHDSTAMHFWDQESKKVSLRESAHLQDLDTEGRHILKFIFKKWDGEEWTGLNWLRIGTVGGKLYII
jgi:hypothetical protein